MYNDNKFVYSYTDSTNMKEDEEYENIISFSFIKNSDGYFGKIGLPPEILSIVKVFITMFCLFLSTLIVLNFIEIARSIYFLAQYIR